jgi:cyclic beta-1,2-glucan synthetase
LNQLSDALKSAGALNDEVARALQTMKELAAAGAEGHSHWRTIHLTVSRYPWSALNAAVTRVAASASDSALSPESLHNMQIWLERVKHHLHAIQMTLETMFPWAEPCDAAPSEYDTIASRLLELLDEDVSLTNNKRLRTAALRVLGEADEPKSKQDIEWLDAVCDAIENGFQAQDDLQKLLEYNAKLAEEIAYSMNFGFLYDSDTRLFCIGYNVSSDLLDPHYYDLLASEARMTSYFAIAKHDVPAEHWFSLGRPVTKISGEPSLLSWNGSLFEFLMPSLLLRSSQTTLLARSERAAVEIQRRFARKFD